jgi:parallel beta-helix repeat protein
MSAYAKAGAFLVVGTRSMKLRRFAILSSVFVCFSTSAPAFAATLVVDNDFLDCPQADFSSIRAAVIAAEPGDKILVCPGEYVEVSSPQAAVLVDKSDLRIEAQAAPGVVLLQGTRAQPFGFHLLNTTGVLLQGFKVQGFGRGNIRIEGSTAPLGISSGNTLRKNVTTDAGTDGIQVVNSSANVVEQNISFNNLGPSSDGIFVCGVPGINPLTDPCTPSSSGNIIRHNQTSGNRIGIHLNGTGPDNVVLGNQSYNNRVRGISLEQSGQTVIEHNHVFANGLTPIPGVLGVGNGIGVRNSNGVTVRNNRSENNGAMGIALNAASNNVVSNNRSESNRMAGIIVTMGASNNLVEKNEIFQNVDDGIRLVNNADRNIVQLNHVRRNGGDGIHADMTSTENTIERNVIRESGNPPAHFDARDDSFGPGTGGTANFWIDNKCETENRPGLCEHPDH